MVSLPSPKGLETLPFIGKRSLPRSLTFQCVTPNISKRKKKLIQRTKLGGLQIYPSMIEFISIMNTKNGVKRLCEKLVK